MTTTALQQITIAFLLALALHVAPAQADPLARTYVSAEIGNDANDCDRLTPCRNFQRAHDNTLPNGDITVLDPGAYGAVTITKAISIINDGVGEAGMLVSGGLTGITISAGASDAVSLRSLTVKGIGFGGGTGIRFTSGKFLTIENFVVRNMTGNGIEFFASGASGLVVTNTLVADNGGTGIFVRPSGTGAVKAEFTRVEAYGNRFSGFSVSGLQSFGRIEAAATDSIAANNGDRGFIVLSDASHAPTSLMVTRSISANNGTGLSAVNGATAFLRVGESAVTGNTTTWTASSGGFLRSYGNNSIDGNADGDPAPPVIVKK